MTMRSRWQRWLLPVAALALTVTGAAAQLKPWPDQQPQPPQRRPAWPGESRPARRAGGRDQPASPPPPTVAPPPPMMAPPAWALPAWAARRGKIPAWSNSRKLRGEVEKAGKVAKAVNDRKGSREEFCKAITGLHGAQVKWVKYTQENAKSCGIPPDVITQLKAGASQSRQDAHQRLQRRWRRGWRAAAPSLSEALGTRDMPVNGDEAPRNAAARSTR